MAFIRAQIAYPLIFPTTGLSYLSTVHTFLDYYEYDMEYIIPVHYMYTVLCTYLSIISLSAYLAIYPSIYLPLYLSIHLSKYSGS